MPEPYSSPVTPEQPVREPRPVLRLVTLLEPVEQDGRDAELRGLLDGYYQQMWALARARSNPPRRTPRGDR